MMERVDGVVEPPFSRRRVQWTLLVIASLALLYVATAAWRTARVPPSPRFTAGQNDAAHVPSARIEIDLNQADTRELSLLPGVGPILAKRIVENRDRLGSFKSVEDLGRVHGIGPRTLEQIRIFCVVGDVAGSRIAATDVGSLADDRVPREARLASTKPDE